MSAQRDIILVVDDTPETLGLLTDALEHAGLTVLVATGALCPTTVFAASFSVDIRGVDDRALRAELRDALGSLPNPPGSRLEARRRAEEAGDKVIAVLRSEGYYD